MPSPSSTSRLICRPSLQSAGSVAVSSRSGSESNFGSRGRGRHWSQEIHLRSVGRDGQPGEPHESLMAAAAVFRSRAAPTT